MIIIILWLFDLMSTQEASHDFIHPELTNCTISVELKIDAGPVNNVEFYLWKSVHPQFMCVQIEKLPKKHSYELR